MSISVLSGQLLKTNGTTLLNGATAASVACFLRINNLYGVANGILYLGKQFGNAFSIFRSGGFSTQFLQWDSTAGTHAYTPTLAVGTIYHLAMTYNAGTINYYINGVLVNTATSGTALANNDTSYLGIGSTNTTTADFEISQAVAYSGYAFTQADVLALRNQTTAPNLINGGTGLALYYSCAGTTGNNVALNDPGISYTGLSIASITGTPQYTAPLVYTPPAYVAPGYPQVGPSGQTLIYKFVDINGNPTLNAAAPSTAPTYTVNGGAPVTCTNPLWPTTLPWIVYPMAAAVQPTDVLTWSGVDSWATTAAGPVSATTNGAVTNLTGGSLLANTPYTTYKPPGTRINLRVGFNLEKPVYYLPARCYANLMKEASFWIGTISSYDSNGYPTAATGNPYCIVMETNSGLAGQAGAPPSGTWTVRWDGLGTASFLGLTNCTVTGPTASSTGNATGNWATYSITRTSNSPNYDYGVGVQINLTGGLVNNIRAYRPGVATDGSAEFDPNFLQMLKGAKSLRFMDWLTTNATSVVSTSNIQAASRFTYAIATSGVTFSVTQIANDPNADNYLPTANRTPVLVTTSAPHGLVDGQTVTLSSLSSTIPCNSGANTLTPNMNNASSAVVVRSATTFGMVVFVGNNTASGPYLVTNPVTLTGTASLNNDWMPPIQPMIDLCNQVGADMWFNVPHAASDALVTSIFSAIGNPVTGLRPNLRCIPEVSNEHWNSASAFTQYWYWYGQGVRAGLSGDQFYAQRTGHIHSVALAALQAQGWGGTMVHEFGSWFGGPSTTTAMAQYCSQNGIPMDAIHIAPYLNGNLYTSTWNIAPAVGDLFTTPMAHDITSLQFVYDNFYAPYFTQHQTNLDAYFPSARINCYEGGPQSLGNASASATTGAAASLAWGRHSRLAESYWALLDVMIAYNVDAYNHFTISQGAGTVTFTNDSNWGCYLGYAQQPGVGDGSDGQWDNNANPTNMDEIVSVSGLVVQQAIALYNGSATNVAELARAFDLDPWLWFWGAFSPGLR